MKRFIMFIFIVTLCLSFINIASAQKSRALGPNSTPMIYKKTLAIDSPYVASMKDTLPNIASQTWGQSYINLNGYELDLGGVSYAAVKTIFEDSTIMYTFLEYKDKDSTTWVVSVRDTVTSVADLAANKFVRIFVLRDATVNYISDPDAVYRIVNVCPSTAAKQGVTDPAYSQYLLWKP